MEKLVEKHNLSPHFPAPVKAVFTSSLLFQVPLANVHTLLVDVSIKDIERKLVTSIVSLTFFFLVVHTQYHIILYKYIYY